MPTTRNDDAANQDKKRTYPYTFQFCVLCQKNVHSSKLPCHIRQCHVGKPMFQCPACDFTSTYSKNNVKSHMVSLHGLAGDPISYMDQYAGQVEEFMKKCFPNVRGRGRPVHGRSSPISPSLANGAVNGSASGDTTPVAKRPTTIRHSHSRQQRHRSSNTRFPNAYNISALTSLPTISKVEPNSELMQLNANSPMNILQETLNVNRFSPYSPHRPRPNRETPVPSVMDFLSAAVAAQTQKTQQASVKIEQKNEPLSSLPVVAVLGSQDPTELTSLNDIATIEFCDTLSPLGSQGKVLNDAVAALVHHDMGLSKDDLERFTALKVVVRIGSDVGNIDVRAATELGIAVCNTPAECVEETADSTMSLILNMYRKTFWLAKIAESGTKVERSRWFPRFIRPLRPKSLINCAAWHRVAVEFGEALLPLSDSDELVLRLQFAHEASVSASFSTILYCQTESTVRWAWNDAGQSTTFCCAPTVYHFTAAIQKMKPHAYLVNTSRRELVAEEALLEALKSGHVKAAALDIQDDTARGIWSNMPNVICTPNASWISAEASKEMRESATREIRRALEGQVPQDLLNCLNKHELVAAQSTIRYCDKPACSFFRRYRQWIATHESSIVVYILSRPWRNPLCAAYLSQAGDHERGQHRRGNSSCSNECAFSATSFAS
ncbi:D-isomer specific 2-hydroxyacid dehydrogenase [Aphelenchoides avenae]|nr:D-isomer specific 2-hydroxyacid dehydrogenase [Aphelenchus avenae]